METQLLKEENVFPSKDVLESALGESYSTYKAFSDFMESADSKLTPEWRYYKDGKAWLCKVSHKKKTVIWVSAWSGFFRVAFYFTEKNGTGINDLDIKEAIKKNYQSGKPIGKLKPLVIDVHRRSQLHDIYTLIEYKKAIK